MNTDEGVGYRHSLRKNFKYLKGANKRRQNSRTVWTEERKKYRRMKETERTKKLKVGGHEVIC